MPSSHITPGAGGPDDSVPRGDPGRLEEEERHYQREYEGRRIDRQGENDVVSSIIPYRNAMALTAYYLGVFSLIPCLGLLLGPAALILGILGIRYVNRHSTAKGTGHAITGVVLGSLTTLGNWGFVGFLVISAATSK
jgi:hypothetical protein